MRATMILVALAACRIGFDSTGADAPEPPRDGIDDDATAGNDGLLDTPSGVCVEAPCMAAGGVCLGDTCVITSTSESALSCPSGMPCRIECSSGIRPCRDGVSCGGATTCEVHCIGSRACQNGVSCGTSTCTVTCDGGEACETGITVGPNGTCTSHCCGTEACDGGIGTCTGDAICS